MGDTPLVMEWCDDCRAMRVIDSRREVESTRGSITTTTYSCGHVDEFVRP